MKKIIILILILIVFFAGAYLILNKSGLIPCSLLSEEQCQLNDSCVGKYGSSACNKGMCTSDFAFKGCQKK